MDGFIKFIREQNKRRIGWIVLWLLGLFIFTCKEGVGKLSAGVGYTLFGAGLLLIASIDYMINYLVAYRGAGDLKVYMSETVRGDGSLVRIMKAHSFDVDAYFNGVMKRLLPLQLVSMGINLVFIFVKIHRVSDALIVSGLILLIPTAVNLITRSVFKYLLTHEAKRTVAVLKALSRGFFNLVKLVAGVAAALMLVILIISIVSSNIIMKDISNDEVVRVSTGTDAYMAVALIASAVFIYLILDGSYHLLSALKRHIIAVFFAAAAIGGIVMFVMTASKDNVTIREDSFTVKKAGKSTDYTIDEVESFRVYEYDNAVQVELTVKGGEKIRLFDDSMDDTDAWADKYTSDYDYAAKLSERLMSKGISGTLEERDELEKIVKNMNKKNRDGFEELKAVFDK
ncbi:MAG: hypothetical protein IJ703_06705 [Eubacterium sp.]|nr:hypothetical protein [Eubacterium sp.]